MVEIHVPLWTIQTAHDLEEGVPGRITHYFTEAHCNTSFWWSLDEYMRYEHGARLSDPAAMSPEFLHHGYWTKILIFDGDDFDAEAWEYKETRTPINGSSFPVTYVFEDEMRPYFRDVCWACASHDHDICQINFHRQPTHLKQSRGGNLKPRWTGDTQTDYSAFAMARRPRRR